MYTQTVFEVGDFVQIEGWPEECPGGIITGVQGMDVSVSGEDWHNRPYKAAGWCTTTTASKLRYVGDSDAVRKTVRVAGGW